ncbi:Protein ATP11, mitochondrial [Cyphellophora attinorum]|uniref:Protein ATP11, mitochondrial n=1 Tax=Cyphellophora attinorum TaxID=1664694 RepID=A0A0N1HY63_9EURO|nr:Protein ATP11, mitochondrial [Phialophora attinorum]KPI45714.1 Protein ATP11, mitochondrial [Phialophora attinorum]
MPPPPRLLVQPASTAAAASVRLPARRTTTIAPLPAHISQRLSLRPQRRHARVHDVRFVTTQQTSSAAITEKYRAKLQDKARAEGLESISELKEVYKEKISDVRRKAATIGPPIGAGGSKDAGTVTGTGLQHPPPPPPTPQPHQAQGKGSPTHKVPDTGIKPLSSYLDLEKIASLPAKEIELIWRLRHASDPNSLTAVIPLSTYNRMLASAQKHPQFILPLPRPASDDGSGDIQQAADGFAGKDVKRTTADVHFLQWAWHAPSVAPTPGQRTANTHTSTVIFTHLAAFKLHGEHAQPHTTITHHLDLADSHELVLLNGGVVNGRGVSAEEARWLLMCLQKFYDVEGHGGGMGKDKRQELMRKFSTGDTTFSLEELLDEAERVS